MKSRIKFSQQRAALFNIPAEKAEKIKAAFDRCGIETLIPDRGDYGEKTGYLLNVPGYAKSGAALCETAENPELIVFADFTERTLDKALDSLRKDGLPVRFKAVLTKYNVEFTLGELMGHMLAEEKRIAGENKQHSS